MQLGLTPVAVQLCADWAHVLAGLAERLPHKAGQHAQQDLLGDQLGDHPVLWEGHQQLLTGGKSLLLAQLSRLLGYLHSWLCSLIRVLSKTRFLALHLQTGLSPAA